MGLFPAKFMINADDFDFEIVNFPFLDGAVPRAASYGVYISQLTRFARVSSHVTDFNTRNKLLTAKLLNQGYRYHNIRKKRKEKSPGCATITNRSPSQTPRGRGNRQIQTSTNRTNVRKALRLALSSPSEVIAILKGLKNTRTK